MSSRHARAGPLGVVSTAPPQQAAASASPPKKATTTTQSKGKGKLTDLHGEPPINIRRPNGPGLIRGKMLGEGGFARVYSATEEADGALKAVKVISKQQLQSTKNRTKLFAEIKLHQAMKHPRIVNFEGCFEDGDNVYMTLQMCAGGSMLDILKKRKRYTEPEARFFLVQLIGACEYMHGRSVIHRDLKLGNLLLDEAMNLCVADFGLAALVQFPGERKKTICGTPNYIAPEILFDQEAGHSYEVDIWSIGVILYTLLVGKPPFQTKEVKVIYKKIKALNYSFPEDMDISAEAIDLVSQILHRDPRKRPQLHQILDHPFLHCGPFPACIPSTATSEEPDFAYLTAAQSASNFARARRHSGAVPASATPAALQPTLSAEAAEAAQSRVERETQVALAPTSPIAELLRSARKPLQVSPSNSHDLRRKVLEKENARSTNTSTSASSLPAPINVLRPKNGISRTESGSLKGTAENGLKAAKSKALREVARLPSRELYESVLTTLELAINAKTPEEIAALAKVEVTTPKVFITSWVDYTHKYGTAYALTDGTVGFYFNDSSTMALAPNKQRVDYLSSKTGSSTYSRRNYTLEGEDGTVPKDLDRKVYLLQYFDTYMASTLDRDADWCFKDNDRIKDFDFLVRYYRMKNAIIFKLSNGVLQFNFFDHTKILLTDSGNSVTLIGQDSRLKTYSLSKLIRDKPILETLAASHSQRQKKLDQVNFIVAKLKYCAEVLRALSVKRSDV